MQQRHVRRFAAGRTHQHALTGRSLSRCIAERHTAGEFKLHHARTQILQNGWRFVLGQPRHCQQSPRQFGFEHFDRSMLEFRLL